MEKESADTLLSRWVSIFLVFMLAVLLVFNTVSYLTIRQYDRVTQERQKEHALLVLLERSLGGLQAMQSAVRSLAFFEDRSYLEAYPEMTAQVTQSLERAGGLVSSSSSKERLRALSLLAQKKIEFQKQVVSQYEQAGPGSARSLIEAGQGEALMARARDLIEGWRRDQEVSISRADIRVDRAARQTLGFLAFGSVLTALLLVVAGVGFGRGLRLREKMERELARLAGIVESSDDAIISKSLEGRILTWNKAAQRIYGFSPEEVIGRHVSYVVPVTHQKELKEILERVARGEHLKHFQTKRLTKDGRLIDVSLTISPLEDKAGRIVGASAIGRDITEQKKMEDEVSRALEIKSRFISIASHEVRSPLTAIREGISLIVDGLRGPVSADQKDILDVALHNIDRLARLSTEILNFQKIESGELRLVRAWHDVREVLDEVAKTVRPLADEKGLALTVRAEGDLSRIVCDKDKITQVILNLVTNALKFTEAGSVQIEARREPDALHVTVRDTGPGIADRDMPRLFQSFQQFGAAPEKGGSGMGLYISRQFVQAHGGRIWAESELGKGSTFHFTIPLER